MLELDHVTFQYGPGLPLVLDDVSLSVGKGEFIAVTGRNGSGKTTITRLLTGLEKPVKGRILYNGKNVTEEDPSRRSRFIGYVFQQPDRQMFMPTVREEVAFGPYHQGKRGAELENAIDRALEATDTKRLEMNTPAHFPGGTSSASLSPLHWQWIQNILCWMNPPADRTEKKESVLLL